MIYLLGMILIALVSLAFITYKYLRQLVEAVGNPVPVNVTIEQPVEPERKEASFQVETELEVLQDIRTELLRTGELRI